MSSDRAAPTAVLVPQVSPVVTAEEIERFARVVLTSIGVSIDQAGDIAAALAYANLSGVDSHGVARLPQYVTSLQSGRIAPAPEVKVVHRTPTTALVDAGGGYGFTATLLAVRLAVELVTETFVAAVGVANSRRFGMAGLYTKRIAGAGLIGLATTTSTPLLAPPAGTLAVVGNSPISIALPRPDGDPIVLDMALSIAAFGWIRMAAAAHQTIPGEWALDRNGEPTTDATEAFEARLANPIGGPKGYGWPSWPRPGRRHDGQRVRSHGRRARRRRGRQRRALPADHAPDAFVSRASYAAGIAELVADTKSVPTRDAQTEVRGTSPCQSCARDRAAGRHRRAAGSTGAPLRGRAVGHTGDNSQPNPATPTCAARSMQERHVRTRNPVDL